MVVSRCMLSEGAADSRAKLSCCCQQHSCMQVRFRHPVYIESASSQCRRTGIPKQHLEGNNGKEPDVRSIIVSVVVCRSGPEVMLTQQIEAKLLIRNGSRVFIKC
jgi:uncharacterized protein (DUF3084 family)